MQADDPGNEVNESEWESGRSDGPANGDSEWVNLDVQEGSAEGLNEDGEKEQIVEKSEEDLDVESLRNELAAARLRVEVLEKENEGLRKEVDRSTNQADHYASIAGTKDKECMKLHEQLAKQAEAKSDGVEAMMEEMAAREQMWKTNAGGKIAYASFEAGDLALFLPTSLGHFIAFNKGCPFRFLSPESLSAAQDAAGGSVEYVLGQIVEIHECLVRLPQHTHKTNSPHEDKTQA